MPRLGKKYDIKIETISKSPKEYHTDEYFELDLPVAPAIMVENEIVVEGADVSEKKLVSAIKRHLGFSKQESSGKRIIDRLLKR